MQYSSSVITAQRDAIVIDAISANRAIRAIRNSTGAESHLAGARPIRRPGSLQKLLREELPETWRGRDPRSGEGTTPPHTHRRTPERQTKTTIDREIGRAHV